MKIRIKKSVLIVLAAVFAALAVAGAIVGIVFAVRGKNNKVTVKFETNGGKAIAPITLKKGEELALPIAEKEDRVFSDWYYDGTFSSVCPKKITVNKDETLYARYSAILTFVTGGTEISPIAYYEGEEIGTLPVSYKDGFSFGGWYYDNEYGKIVGKKDLIERALTVYARFSEKSETIRKLTSVKNVSASPSVEIKTDGVILHNDNVSDYLSFVSSSDEKVSLICKPSENGTFIVEPNKTLDEGMTYSLRALSSSLKVVAVDGNDTENADEVTITTHKEEKEVIEKKPTVHLTSSELAKWEENVYVYMDAGLEKDVNRIVAKTDKEIGIGSIVTVGETEKKRDDDYICKVISVKKENMQYVVGTEVKEDEFTVMEVVTPNVDDIYDEIDVYGERQAQLEGVIEISPETVAENVEKNEGVVLLKNAVRNAVKESPTIANYANSLPEAEKAELMAAIGGFNFQKPKVRLNISGTTLEFEIELGGEIQIKNLKVGVTVTIKNKTQVDYRYTICKSGLITLNPLLWFYTDVKVDLFNDFSISLAATVEFADSDDAVHGIIDITDEVEYVMDISKDGQNKFAEAITGSPLWDDEGDLEYADIFSIPLGQIPLPVPVVSLMLEFNVVGSMGAKAGLYVEFSHHYVETTSLTNGQTAAGDNGKPVMYNEFKFTRATTANEIGLAITLKGQVGFRCGLEAKLSLSVLKLNSVASVYVSFRFGPYIELSGLVSFRYSYDAVNKTSETHLYGGMYLEVGLFVNAKLGAKFLVYDVNTDIFDKKIPLYGVGDRLIPLGFAEQSNSPENPYVTTTRYGGVKMSTVQMRYLDIATGDDEVYDSALRNRYGAQLWYEFELVDDPDYQTRDYDKYVTISNGSPIISRNFPFKSLKYVVKVKLLPRYGVYASGIERIFYVEYRNKDGRDYATQYSEFRNEYYAGGGSNYSETLARLAFTEGEQVVPPDFTAETLPVRPGYYLDMNDLWEKYYPFLEDKVDEDFDGKFPVVTYENATVIYKGYLIVNTCYYRLKWKRRSFTATFSSPVYLTADVVTKNETIKTAEMLYVPSLRYFIVLTDGVDIPDIKGKKYEYFSSTSGLRFNNDYYTVNPNDDAFVGFDIKAGLYPAIRVDEQSELYLNDFDGIKNGVEFVATYSDKNVYTETYVLETETVKRAKVEYKPFDYDGEIRPLPPEEFKIGGEFTESGNTYVIKGYRDINPEDEANCRYYDTASMPNVDKNRIYYLLYEREGLKFEPVYYVNIVANGRKIGDYGVIRGEKIKIDTLKGNFDDKRVVSSLAGYPLSQIDEAVKDYSVVWNDADVPTRMPDRNITINLEVSYTLSELTAEFVVSDPLQSFAGGVTTETRPNGDRVYTAKGKTWTYGSTDDTAFYSLPKLNDYIGDEGRKYYAFYGWKNSLGEELPYGIRTAFVKNERYEPIFTKKTVLPTIAFISVSDYGYEYYYRIVEGDYFGKTLAEAISLEKIDSPVRGDVNGVFEYEFTGWGVDENAYKIGSEKDADGNVKTYIVFKAEFSEKGKPHTATFDAMDGEFDGGRKTLEKVGVYGDDISSVTPRNYSNEKGDFVFVCWTTVPYSLENKVDKEDLKIGNADITYYAYYSLNPATITLTFRGKVETEAADGTGNVYFGGDKSKTELKVSDLYGRGYYLTASEFAVDSKSKTFVPDYLKWTVDGEELRSAFYNDGYMAYIPFDDNATVEIVFKKGTAKIVNIAFVSDGECFESDGTKTGVICKGYMSGFRHVANYYEKYGTTMAAPNVDYFDENYYRFDRWETKPTDGSPVVSVKAGETITFTEDIVFYGVYVHDELVKVELTFRADPSYGSVESDGDLTGLKIFDDGSVEITDFGIAGENITFDKIPSCKGMRFVGWKAKGSDTIITQSELKETVYSVKTTYYAVYESAAETFKITLNAANGKFGDGKTEKTIEEIPFGRLACELEKPTPNAQGIVFSHYENEDGYPVTVIEKGETLIAKYAKPVSTFEELQNINLSPEQNYVLQNDITHGGNVWDETNLVNWTAIGANTPRGFSGTFNGNGHKISVSAKSGAKQNFGLFSKISGTVYNLSVVGYFPISGSSDATSLGGFASEVAESGRIIDCQSFIRLAVYVNATEKLSVSGAIGVNNGLIDGLMTSASGEINIDGNKEFTVGATVGTNNGTMRNVNQSGRGGSVYVTLARSLNCNIGSFAGYNSGKIENCFSERAITINLSQGDNVYLENSVSLGGFAGKNDGTIVNSTTLCGDLEYSVSNITLFKEKGLYLSYISYLETPRYIVYAVGKDDQGPTYTTKCVIYLDENAQKTGSTEYEEYTLSEFAVKYPSESKKIDSLRKAVAFGGFVSANSGKTDNCTVIEEVGTGNGVELVSSCNFDELKWNYLARLHDTVYNP